MAEHRVAELGLEPRALGRHDAASIGDGHQVLDARGEHAERAGVFAAIHKLLQFRRAADAADEIDLFARARISDAEDRVEHELLEQRHVELLDGVARGSELRPNGERVPLTANEETEFVFACGLGRAVGFDDKDAV